MLFAICLFIFSLNSSVYAKTVKDLKNELAELKDTPEKDTYEDKMNTVNEENQKFNTYIYINYGIKYFYFMW